MVVMPNAAIPVSITAPKIAKLIFSGLVCGLGRLPSGHGAGVGLGRGVLDGAGELEGLGELEGAGDGLAVAPGVQDA